MHPTSTYFSFKGYIYLKGKVVEYGGRKRNNIHSLIPQMVTIAMAGPG